MTKQYFKSQGPFVNKVYYFFSSLWIYHMQLYTFAFKINTRLRATKTYCLVFLKVKLEGASQLNHDRNL